MNYYIDFEFRSSSEKNMDVLCAAIKSEDGIDHLFWFNLDQTEKRRFQEFMSGLEGNTLIGFATLAECRALRSLGIDPMKYQWIDLYSEWRQLKNKNDRFNYGWIKSTSGEIVFSTPPQIHSTCHIETGFGLTDCVLRLLKIDIDADEKEKMRTLILSKQDFSDAERAAILSYCANDVKFLEEILKKMTDFYKKYFESDRLSEMLGRGRYIAALSSCEHNGTPINIKSLESLAQNYSSIICDVYESMNNAFQLYERCNNNSFVFKNNRFADLVERLGLQAEWPKTKSGYCATDVETIERYRYEPLIDRFYRTKKVISSMRSIAGDSTNKLVSRIGQDERLRSFFGPFGTQTGRNAAKASNFIFAMSNWLRVLIVPPENKAITAIDYSSQEFAIAASLSEDSNMRSAYQSGDPYLYFGIKAGAIPIGGTKDKFKKERDLFKSTTLGLQYGMASTSLARKLTQDLGRPVSADEAQSLIELHQKVYPGFWAWTDYCWHKYIRDGFLETKDGWGMFGNNQNSLSVKNFLIQATGASIMRKAVILAVGSGLEVIAPLHDAIYILHNEDDLRASASLQNCMRSAAAEFVNLEIRMDMKQFNSRTPWVEEKGFADFERFKKYL